MDDFSQKELAVLSNAQTRLIRVHNKPTLDSVQKKNLMIAIQALQCALFEHHGIEYTSIDESIVSKEGQ